MAKDFLHYYELEMQYMRDMCGEFAREFPKIAGRFGMDEFLCEDPYVERLLQGYSFLAAGTHQTLDGAYPEISCVLLNNLYSDFLMPIPSTGIVSIYPDQNIDSPKGTVLKRGTELKTSQTNNGEECYFQTTHDVKLWPITLVDAKYYPDDFAFLGLSRSFQAQSCLKLELKTTNSAKFKDLNMESLEFYLADPSVSMELYEMLLANCSQVILQTSDGSVRECVTNHKQDLITPRGFDKNESLLPSDHQTLEGYRLLRKFFILPQSFMFVQLNKIKSAIKQINSENLEVIFIFNKKNQSLKGKVNRTSLKLFCTPVVNLFEQVFPEINLETGSSNIDLLQHASPENIEILKVLKVQGTTETSSKTQKLTTIHSKSNLLENDYKKNVTYYLNRLPLFTDEERKEGGTETTYSGTNTYLSLVGGEVKPHKDISRGIHGSASCMGDSGANEGADFRQMDYLQHNIERLKVIALCSNRSLPYRMISKKMDTQIKAELQGIEKIKLILGPTRPYSDHLFDSPWKIINYFSMSFSLFNSENDAIILEIIKDAMEIYKTSEKQKENIEGIEFASITHGQQRFEKNGNYSFENGLNLDLVFDEQKTPDYFLMGMIIDRFLTHAAPVNAFIQTTLNTKNHGKVIQLQPKRGTKPLI